MSPPLCSFCISLPCFQLSSALCVPWTPVRLPGCLCERWGQAGTEALCAVRLYLHLSGPGAWSLEPGAVCRCILDMSQNTAAGPMDQPTGPNEWLTVSQCRACLHHSSFFSALMLNLLDLRLSLQTTLQTDFQQANAKNQLKPWR